MLVDEKEAGQYAWQYTKTEDTVEVGAQSIIKAIVADVRAGAPTGTIAARFHNSVAAMVAQMCRDLRDELGLREVVLSGGVWQNVILLGKTTDRLQADGFTVYTHRLVPPNDGGLSLGQAAIANFQI